jgi:hypothetical protein
LPFIYIDDILECARGFGFLPLASSALDRLADVFEGQAMQPEITLDDWWVVESRMGNMVYPASQFSVEEILQDAGATQEQMDFIYPDTEGWIDRAAEEDIEIEQLLGQYGARLQMPGYLDTTEWAVFPNEEEAAEYLIDMYGDE